MDNASSAIRFALIAVAGVLLFNWFFKPKADVESSGIEYPAVVVPATRSAYEYCRIETEDYRAQFTSRGATLKRFALLREKYIKDGETHDLSTTPQPGAVPGTPEEEDPKAAAHLDPGTVHEFRQQLFVQFRNPTAPGASKDANWNVAYDSVDWKIEQSEPNSCRFTYRDASVALEKVIKPAGRPYELSVTSTITNLASETKAHAVSVDTIDWWLDRDVEGGMFRVSPYVTTVVCVENNGTAHRLLPDRFEPEDFSDPEFAATGKYRWYQPAGSPEFAAVSNAYFSHVLVPVNAPVQPVCQVQVEKRGQGTAEPGAFYRARLAYPVTQLEPQQSATYEVLTFVGPKERNLLSAAGGEEHDLSEVIDLGFFASIAKVLVSFLVKVHSIIPNWGVAIIVLTVCARVLLFPLAVPGIRTMIKMRELKPEMDVINEKYKDDVRAKGLAQMELWRKHGLSPFDQVKGCLPQLATMPVWFALYTTLQTAVELYNIPFLWFPDLSEPDPYFILPFIIGGTYFIQQKIMPFQGDPAQRKMMMYMMPAMFTVFMLFLPAGLGVYMFTNSVLAIVQQQAVEMHARNSVDKGRMEVSVSSSSNKKGGGGAGGKTGGDQSKDNDKPAQLGASSKSGSVPPKGTRA